MDIPNLNTQAAECWRIHSHWRFPASRPANSSVRSWKQTKQVQQHKEQQKWEVSQISYFFVFFSPPQKKRCIFFRNHPKNSHERAQKGVGWRGLLLLSNPKLVAIAVLFKAASLRGLFQHTSLEAHRVSDEKLHVLLAHGVLEAIIPPCDVRGRRSCASNVFWNYMIIALNKDIS